MMRLQFISGLPRSGSTLLPAIPRQNPSLRAGMSSPLNEIILGLLRIMSGANEFACVMSDRQR
jgi:sulfotransferase